MLRGTKSSGEVRFELVLTGAILLTAAVIYVVAFKSLPGLMLFLPGLILLGGAIYQDMQPGWKAGWLTYVLAVILVATGLAWIVNTVLAEFIHLDWFIIAAVELGVLLILKALYDPTPKE